MRRPALAIVVLACAWALAGCDRTTIPSAGAPSPSATASASPSPSPEPSPVFASMPALEDPVGIGQNLAKAEAAIRADGTPADQLALAGRVQQAAYRKLVERTEWRQPAIAELPSDLHDDAAANIAAGEKLRKLTKPAEKIPDWQIITPPPSEELIGYYREAEQKFGVQWQYLAAIHLVETRMGRIRGRSSAGAQGPMQFMPRTWDHYGEGDINSPRDSIMAAARYLRASGAPANMRKALYAYNHSEFYVDAIIVYAERMMEDELTFRGYYHWQVYVRTAGGDVLLEEGYGQ